MVEALAVVVFVVLVGERLVQGIRPVFAPLVVWLDKVLPVPEGWTLMVFAWVVLSILTALTGVNLFGGYIADETAGRVLTAVVAGGGANLLHDLWPVRKTSL